MRKKRDIGMKKAAWDSLPMRLSNSFLKHFLAVRIFESSVVQALYLLDGRLIVRVRVLKCQPKTSLVSDGPPSAASLSFSSIGCRGIGSLWATGRQTVCIANGGPNGARSQLDSVSRNVRMMSSMKTSEKPWGWGGGRSMVGRAGAMGVDSGIRDGWGMSLSKGERMELGLQASLANISLERSLMSSLMLHHAPGQPEPPKDSLS